MDRSDMLQHIAENRAALEAVERTRDGLIEERREMIRAALAAGCTRTEIAAEAGISRQRVVQVDESRPR